MDGPVKGLHVGHFTNTQSGAKTGCTVVIAKKLPEGTSTTVEKKDCKNIGCESFDFCTNAGLQNGKTYTITKVYDKVKCPRNFELYKADVVD